MNYSKRVKLRSDGGAVLNTNFYIVARAILSTAVRAY
jgi:hypothetical protein